MSDMQSGQYYYPNQLGRIILMAMEEVMGKNGVNAVLNQAHLTRMIDHYPPNNLELQFGFDEVSTIQKAMEEIYGPRGGRGLSMRIGRACFKYGLQAYGPALGFTDLAFRLLPLDENMRKGGQYFAEIFNQFTDHVPISAVFFLIGTLLFAYYTARPELLPAGVTGDAVFPHFIVTGLPVGLAGLVIASIFAAAQSTIASSVNCSPTLFLCDLYRRYLRPKADERESMTVLRLATVGFGLAGTAMGFAMRGVASALDAWWAVASICSGGMLGLFLLGLISRASNAAAATGTVFGFLVIVWMTISAKWPAALGQWSSPFHSFMITVVGTLAILLVGLLVSRLTPSVKVAMARADSQG